ncbi:MAG TPA: hypothetical protein VMD06_10725 [Steroidobacteraceae bacterium]|nr:hypothetical protein [Steroidobacteraceae bacterium]
MAEAIEAIEAAVAEPLTSARACARALHATSTQLIAISGKIGRIRDRRGRLCS